MSEWKETTLADLCTDISYGYTESAKQEKVGPKFLRITDIASGRLEWDKVPYCPINESDFEKYKLLPGDIVIARTGATTGANYTIKESDPKDVVFASYLIRYKINPQIAYPYYIGQLLKSPNWSDYVDAIAGGSAQPGANAKQLGSFDIILPPLPEQKAIASILSCLDDKIDLLHRQNATLEKMAETLFRQWFVERRPEPVEGEAKEEWEEETFEKWIHETVGGDWGKESIKGDFTKAVCCLRGTDIADLNNGLPNKTPIRFIKENKYQSICPNDGDLIIEVSGGTENQSTGRICYINNQVKTLFNYPLVFSNFCRMIRIKKPEYSFFVYCYIQYLYNQDEFFNLENGSSGIKNLDYKTLLFDLKYKMPDEDSVIKFHNHVKSLFQKVNQNKIQIRTLSTLRDTLLPKLMSGEVTVQE
jgi:type I restriction enzyme S subunit